MSTRHPGTDERKATKHRSMEKTSKKIKNFFRKKTEEGGGTARPSKDEPPRPHTSPAHSAQEKSSSLGASSRGAKKSKDRGNAKGMWRPKKRRGEWESDSGRQLTLQDVSINDLSPLEIEYLQREAVTRLQAMDIAVSHGILKGLSARGAFQRLSSNSQARRKISDKELHAVFGQPLEVLVGSSPRPVMTPNMHSASSTPALLNLEKQVHPPSPSSPTRMTDSPPDELNVTANSTTSVSFDPSSVASPPSPCTLRRQVLIPLGQQVPTIVRKAIEHLDSNGVKLEGLFRIPGSKARMAELRERIDAGVDVELTEDTNPHDVACILKEFFRSLPEPLLTRELYYPFLSTTKLQNPGHRRDALRLLCILLPQPNRDTLKELLQFLSRVSLFSYEMILIDGTQESGNRMTEQNLATVLGPNILHRESKRKGTPKSGGDQYQVCKQDPEELNNVTKVMEDLIRMHQAIFTIPPQLQDPALRQILLVDPDAVDHLLKKRCIDLGLVLPPRENADMEPSRAPATPNESPLPGVTKAPPEGVSVRFSNSQKMLDEALEDLAQYINENLSPSRISYNSNNCSVVAEPEVALSPSTTTQPPSKTTESPSMTTESPSTTDSPSTMTDGPTGVVAKGSKGAISPLSMSKRLYASADSAFSNNSSSHSSTEAVSDIVSDVVSCSEMNTISLSSDDKGFLDNAGYTIDPPKVCSKLVTTHSMPILTLDLPTGSTSYKFLGSSSERGKIKRLITPNSKWRRENMGDFHEIQHSPILSGKEDRQFYDALCVMSSDRTPTDSTPNLSTSTPIAEDGTVI